MDPYLFVESMFGVGGESLGMPQCQHQNQFFDLNEVPISKDIPNLGVEWSNNPIDFDDVNIPEAEKGRNQI